MSQLGTLTMRPVKLPSFGAKQVPIACYDEDSIARLMAEDAKRAGQKPRLPTMPKKVDRTVRRGPVRCSREVGIELVAATLAALTDKPQTTREINAAVGGDVNVTFKRLRRLHEAGKIHRSASSVARWWKVSDA